MDQDGNGELDIEELEAALDKMGECVRECVLSLRLFVIGPPSLLSLSGSHMSALQ